MRRHPHRSEGSRARNSDCHTGYTDGTLTRICDHIDQVQAVIGRRMLLENPSSYLSFNESTWTEPAFMAEIAQRTGCGLLLDINNVFVSATNLDFSPQGYIDAFALERVGEIHLGGHDVDEDDHGNTLLIDSHGSEVVTPVWDLLDYTLQRSGPLPVLYMFCLCKRIPLKPEKIKSDISDQKPKCIGFSKI